MVGTRARALDSWGKGRRARESFPEEMTPMLRPEGEK